MKKTLKIPILLLAATMLLTSCGGIAAGGGASGAENGTASNAETSGDPNEPVSITFYTYNYANMQKDGVDMIITEFKELHPNIDVEVVISDGTTKIQADLAAGITPDVAQIIFDALDYSINNYGIQDLNSIAPAAELEEHLAGFSQAALNVARYDGRLYGLPYTFSTPVLFYNATLFEEAGLDPDSPPATWDEVERYALQIAENTGKEGFTFGGTSIADDWMIQSLIQSNGGNVMSADRKTITFGEQPAAEAIQMLQDMRKSGAHTAMDDNQAMEAFLAGNCGMMLFTAAMQAYTITSANAGGWTVRAAKMPAFAGKRTVPVNSGSGLFILTTDPAKQRAAWEFIKFATGERGYTIITSMMGYPPLRPAIVDDERYLKAWAEENPLAGPNLEQIEVVTPWQSYPGSNWDQISTLLVETVNRCLFTDVDVAQTMRAAQEQAQSLMPRQ
jgi:multiple sugar transport system substrate-binding protein